MDIKGTVSKKLIAYIERVEAYLGLEDLDIEFTISRTCDNDAGGYCHGDEDEVQVEIARIDNAGKLSKEEFLINIAHEMIHAFQLYTGQMIDKGFTACSESVIGLKYVIEWEGKAYSDVPYNDQPWEIDAYSRQKEVYNKCK